MWFILLIVGIFIGWNLPQPWWAKAAQEWFVSLFNRD